jgi:copper chaperone
MSYTVTLKIPNISCGHCTTSIVRETRDLPGVIKAEGDIANKTATFTLENELALNNVKQTLVEIGYPSAN